MRSFHRGLPPEKRAYPARNPVTGAPVCRWCGKDVAKPRRTFCSDGCVHEFKLRSNPGYARLFIFSRDRGVCAQCRTDTSLETGRTLPLALPDPRERPTALKRLMGRWEMDHVLEVAEGGGSAGLDNLQTLCRACHSAKTSAFARERARRRRLARAAQAPASPATSSGSRPRSAALKVSTRPRPAAPSGTATAPSRERSAASKEPPRPSPGSVAAHGSAPVMPSSDVSAPSGGSRTDGS